VFKEISEGIRAFMTKEGYTRLEELTGLAHQES